MSTKAKTNKHLGLKILGTGLGIGLGAFVVNEIRKEYNSTVEENDYLRNFIDTHDFYVKEDSSSGNSLIEQKKRMSSKDLTHVEDLGNGQLRVTRVDPRSGFKCVSIVDKDTKSDLTSNAAEA